MTAILTFFFRPRSRIQGNPTLVTPDRVSRKLMQEQFQKIEAARLCWACPF